jgi:hypothetical protein
MSELLDIRNLIQETTATLEQIERAIAKEPSDWGLALTAESLRHRQNDLQKVFVEIAHIDHLDVCNYRIIPDGESSSIASVTKALGSFQDLVTVVFDAIKNGPKIRARPSADMVVGSTLDFGYAYPGSLGFVFTMPNDRLLLGESELDRAFRAIFQMAKAESPQELAAHVPQVGVAGIRRLYSWSQSHVEYGLSADIKWQRQETERDRVVVQKEELARLREIIDQASEEKVETFTITGELLGLDVGASNSFRLSAPGAQDIYGKIGDAFNKAQLYEIHGRYFASVIKKSKIYYSTEREDEWWELAELRPSK